MARRRRSALSWFVALLPRKVRLLVAAAFLATVVWQQAPWLLVAAAVVAALAGCVWLGSRVAGGRRERARLGAPGEPTVVYRHYDTSGRLLYVGITNNYRRRCEQHADTKRWWALVDPARSTCQTFPNRYAALAAEEAAILSERPVFNEQHNAPIGARQ